MISQTLNYEEILAFQNEFIQINTYMKNFMNVIMGKIKETNIQYMEKKKLLNDNIDELNSKSERVQAQKDSLYKSLLS